MKIALKYIMYFIIIFPSLVNAAVCASNLDPAPYFDNEELAIALKFHMSFRKYSKFKEDHIISWYIENYNNNLRLTGVLIWVNWLDELGKEKWSIVNLTKTTQIGFEKYIANWAEVIFLHSDYQGVTTYNTPPNKKDVNDFFLQYGNNKFRLGSKLWLETGLIRSNTWNCVFGFSDHEAIDSLHYKF